MAVKSGKHSDGRRRSLRVRPVVKGLMSVASLGLYVGSALALPQGGQVAAGNAAIVQQGNVLTVTTAANTILNWNKFNIAVGEISRFNQPSASSSVLNRVVGVDPSHILGTLSSNGRVFLVNPAGIIFGQGARIDTAGFLASTLNITDQNFLRGKLQFEGSGSRILNEGDLKSIGNIYLVAPDIQNSGSIKSENGSVVLAAGQKVLLSEADPNQIVFEVQAPESRVLNLGNVEAGKSVAIFANSLMHRGTIKAVDMAVGEGGKVILTGENVRLAADSSIDVSASNKGGVVLVGGGYRGQNPEIRNAVTTTMESGATINADATVKGDGGRVVLWADDKTVYAGKITARGGAQGGNGGAVETSGKQHLDFRGTVDLRAPNGKKGTLLLDPSDVTIQAAGTTDMSCTAGTCAGSTTTSVLTVSDLQSLLDSGNVIVDASSGGGGGSGSITVADPISWANSSSLTLNASGALAVNAQIDNTAAATIAMTANSIAINSPVSTYFNDINGSGTVNLQAGPGGITHNAPGMIKAKVLNAVSAGGIDLANTENIVKTANLSNTAASGEVRFKNNLATESSVSQLEVSGNNSGGNFKIQEIDKGIKIVGSGVSATGITSLQSGGGIDQDASAVLGGTALRVSGTSVTLNETNPVGVIAGTTANGNFSYHSNNVITLASVDGVDGINAGTGNVILQSGNAINQQLGKVITAHNLSATAPGDIILDSANGVESFDASSTTGNVFLRNYNQLSIVNPTSASNTAAGKGYVSIDTGGYPITMGGSLASINGANGVDLYAGLVYIGNDVLGSTLVSNGAVSIAANNFYLGGSGTINAPVVRIAPLTANRPINIVSSANWSTCNTNGTELCLDSSQLNTTKIPSASLVIGIDSAKTVPGGGTFGPAGAISINDPLNRSGADLYLASSAAINQTAAVNAATLGAVSSGGDVNLNYSGNAANNIVGSAPDANAFNFTSSGSLTVSSITPPLGGATFSGVKAGSVALDATSGAIVINNPVTATGASGHVSLGAYSGITGSGLISGSDLSLNSSMGGNIGPLNTAVSALGANAGSGSISINNAGALTIKSTLTSSGGDISVATTGDLTVGAETTVSAGSGKAITLTSSTGKIEILPLVTIQAPNGTVNLAAQGDINIGMGGSTSPNIATIDATGGSITATSSGGIVNRDPSAVILGAYTASLPSLDFCIANPTLSVCSAVLPTLATCTSVPTTAGCSAVLPTLATCTSVPTTAGCSAVLPTLATCTSVPTTAGCSAVLPTLATCTSAPTTAGCSAVLPTLATCTSAPTTAGCSAVLPTLATCTSVPTTAGCSVVLPTLATCTSAPTTAGCSVVLPTLATCTSVPTTAGCSVVLPTLATCTSAPTTAGCSAVLPTLATCTSVPTTAGCSVVLPTLATCTSAPTTAGCNAVLPTLAACTSVPTTAGCSAVLPTTSAAASSELSESRTVQAPVSQIVSLTSISVGSSMQTATGNTGTASSTTSNNEGEGSGLTEEDRRRAAGTSGQASVQGGTTTSNTGVPACR